jgi:hypothetical protein
VLWFLGNKVVLNYLLHTGGFITRQAFAKIVLLPNNELCTNCKVMQISRNTCIIGEESSEGEIITIDNS